MFLLELLSGGLDSSIITKLTCDELGPVSTYSVGFDDIADPYHGVADESVYAEEFARSLGCKHTTIKLTERDIRNHIDTFVMAAARALRGLLRSRNTFGSAGCER